LDSLLPLTAQLELPHNLLIIDVTVYESCLFKAGLRGAMLDGKTGLPRQTNSLLTLRAILHSLHVPINFPLHNSGNDAFACLLVFQMLVDPKNTQVPPLRINPTGIALARSATSMPFLSPMLNPSMMTAASMPRSQSASNIPHLNIGDSLTIPRQSRTLPNHLSVIDTDASAGIPDEEGRIRDTEDPLSSTFAQATIG
jgi:hypothetical protein